MGGGLQFESPSRQKHLGLHEKGSVICHKMELQNEGWMMKGTTFMPTILFICEPVFNCLFS